MTPTPDAGTLVENIVFSSAQDPKSWEPNTKRAGKILTCLTNEDAKQAAQLFNELIVRAEKAEAALASSQKEVAELREARDAAYDKSWANVQRADRAEKDAERYRWWRDRYWGSDEALDEVNRLDHTSIYNWEAAMDAAISAGKER